MASLSFAGYIKGFPWLLFTAYRSKCTLHHTVARNICMAWACFKNVLSSCLSSTSVFFHSFRELPDLAYNSYIRTIAKILDRVFRPFTMFRVNLTITKYMSLFFHQLLYLLQFCLLYQKLVILARKLIIDFSNSGSIMGNIVNELS